MTIITTEIEKRKKQVIQLESPNNSDIYTPPEIVSSINNKFLSIDKNIFDDSTKKILDPCMKNGIFLVEIVLILMKKLENFISNEEKRYMYILKNMIHGYTTDYRNFEITKTLLLIDKYPMIAHNLKLFDSFEEIEKYMENTKLKFNFILQNPPYQKNGTTGDVSNTRSLWEQYILLSLKYLENNGYLGSINPPGYRNVGGKFAKIKDTLLKNNIIYLQIFNLKDGQHFFSCDTRFDIIICQKKKYSGTTLVKFENTDNLEEYDLNFLPFIPNEQPQEFIKLLSNNSENKLNIINDTATYHIANKKKCGIIQDTETEEYNIPIIYSINRNEFNCKYSKKNLGHVGIPKLIKTNGVGEWYIDVEGKYGCSQFCFFIPDTDIKYLSLLKKTFETKKFANLEKSCHIIDSPTNHRVLSLFKKDFWKYFIDKDYNELK